MTSPRAHRVLDADSMRELGERLGSVLSAGDVVLLIGGLGAGKTTFTQGLGKGLGVQGQITSPTYIVARVHDALADGPDLVHVDAYRLEDDLDLETVDLDASADEAVTVVEWGRGRAEGLSDQRLEIEFSFVDPDEGEEDPRHVTFIPVGEGWHARLQEAGL